MRQALLPDDVELDELSDATTDELCDVGQKLQLNYRYWYTAVVKRLTMKLQLEDWHLGYAQILRDCRLASRQDHTDEDDDNNHNADDDSPTTGSALILCNADADAMAAARILTYMLRSDGIAYQLRPCTSYSALRHILSNRGVDDSSLRAVLLLNLGSSKNLTKLFSECHLSTRTKLFVMDCRRPFHLANIYAGENIVVFWDQTQTDIPSDGDNLSGNDSTTSEEEESSSDDDDDSDEEKAVGDDPDEGEEEFDDGIYVKMTKPAKRVRKSRDADHDDDDDDDASDYDGEDELDKDEMDDDDDDDKSIDSEKDSRIDGALEKDDGMNDMDDPAPEDDFSRSEGSPEQTPTMEDEASPTPSFTMTPRELHLQRRIRVRTYYSEGSFYGSPAAYVAYRLSIQLRFGQLGDLLWLACVGVTDAYQHSRLDVAGYTTLAMDLRHQCQRLFPNDMYHRVGNAIYAEQLAGGQTGSQLTKIGASDNGRILSEKDYRFFLLRHTSLFESMVHSNYISTKLQVWTNRGMHKLQELLAKMGFPLEECRQPYAFMKPTLKRRLGEQIANYAEEYGLGNFEYTSFFRVTGFKSLLSASDTSYAITALLECETAAVASNSSGRKSPDEDEETLQAFSVAFDALSSSSTSGMNFNGLGGAEGSTVSNLVNGGVLSGQTGIGAGIRLALLLQRSIISTAVSLVDRNAIVRLRHFRYAYITCTSLGESQTRQDLIRPQEDSAADQKTHIFAKPLALTKLAHFLMDMHRENGKWTGAKARPLVLLAEKPQSSTYLVVGYEFAERAGNFVKNRFGQNFELAASSMKGVFKFDSFDSNVVEVSSADVQRFIEQLHYLMDSM